MSRWLLLSLWFWGAAALQAQDARSANLILREPDPGVLPNTYFQEGKYRYLGPQKDGLAEGEGRLLSDTGKPAYEGSFVQGLPEGQGTLYDLNGFRIYTGEFRAGRFHGVGTLFRDAESGILFEGRFENGVPVR
jgi:hypothetical protein